MTMVDYFLWLCSDPKFKKEWYPAAANLFVNVILPELKKLK